VAPQPLQQADPTQVGRYRLTARLGSGGMGVVYLGQGPDGRQVAVKVLRPEYADDPEFRARFEREVSAMERVRNRYTVRVLDADTNSATPFLATQFADGPSLTEQVQANGPLHPDAVVMLASALAEALAAIHAAGVTHRDLKPSNVLLTNAGPMVIDFGIAQIADTVSITRTGMAVGSPGYMAPEQVTGHAGREADIYTWALMVSYAASGQPPFGGGPTAAILHRILSEEPDISAVPPRLMPLVRAALNKEPQGRPSAVDLLRELSPGAAAAMAMAVDQGGLGTRLDNNRDAGRTRRMDAGPDRRTMSGPRTAAGGGWPEQGTRTSGSSPRSYYDDEPPRRGNARRWAIPAAIAAVLVIVVVVSVALLSNGGGSNNSPSTGTTTDPSTSTSAPAQTGVGVSSPTAPANDQGNGNGGRTSSGQTGSNGNGNGDSGNTGSGGNTQPTTGTSPSDVPTSTAPSEQPTSTAPTGGAAGGASPPASSTAAAGALGLG
jgi:serine/threonine protein kinase